MVLAVNNLVGFGGGGGGDIPSFIGASTGTTNTGSSTLSVNYPSSIQANDIIICVVQGEDTSGASTGDTSFGGGGVTNFSSLGNRDGNGGASASGVFYKRATGSESGTETATMVAPGGPRSMTGIMYLFRGCITSGDPTNGFSSSDNAVSSTWSQQSLTTTVGACLGCNVIAAVANSATAGSFTGETGGDWTEANIYSSANGTIQLQTASLPSATTISGGSVAASVAGKYQKYAFGLQPAT